MLTPALRPPTDKAEVIALSSPCPGPDEQRARTQGAPLAAAASAYVVTLGAAGHPPGFGAEQCSSRQRTFANFRLGSKAPS
jgi:hypothetical protein